MRISDWSSDVCSSDLLELAELGLGDLGGLLRSEGDLEGGVAVVLVCLDLHDAAGLDPEDGHGDDAVVVIPDLGHAYLLADDCLCRLDACISLFAAAGTSSSEELLVGKGGVSTCRS